MKIHFIAIGGSIMHNLAISLKRKGYDVSGSDDLIFEPAKGRLENNGLLPAENGWHPDKITSATDAVIVGMHAREDNPELLKAKQLGVKIYSFPEYVYEQSKNKTRVVIGGSHGKTTITSMIMHVLRELKQPFDYLVGALVQDFDLMVQITDAPVIILEGDEYLASPIHKKPKFLYYKPQVALVSGIAWDHINVFPTFDNYVEQFREFARTIEPGGAFIYFEEDEQVVQLAAEVAPGVRKIPYTLSPFTIENEKTFLRVDDKKIPLQIFGNHNLQNLEGARLVCRELGIKDRDFYEAISTFKGASRRLEVVKATAEAAIYKDFAHAPSKLKATVNALKNQFPERKLVACIELHTFSSLNKHFLKEYKNTMKEADVPVVFYDPRTLQQKNLPDITREDIISAFDEPTLQVYTDTETLKVYLENLNWEKTNLLLMSSGNFGGLKLDELATFVNN